jgi:hypothetical protein
MKLASCVQCLLCRFLVEKVRSLPVEGAADMSARTATAEPHVAQRGTSTVAQRTSCARADVAQPRLVARASSRASSRVWALELACIAALAPLACSGGGPSKADAGKDANVQPAVCLAATACDGATVRACRGGQLAEIVETCAPDWTCSDGRCTSIACAQAEDKPSFVGCLFYTMDLDNVTSDDALPASVLLTNPGQRAANVSLERRAAGAWSELVSVTVAAHQSTRLTLPDSHVEGGGRASEAALRLTSDLPVTAAHIQSDDSLETGSSSTSGTLLLPAHALGRRYRALTYKQLDTPRLAATAGARGGAGQIVVVGTQERTTVTVTATQRLVLGTGGGAPPDIGPGGQFTVSLEDGDLLQLFSVHDGDDLAGTEIAGDKPIAVFSGNISTSYVGDAPGINSPDMADEQLLPTTSWATSFVAAALMPQAGTCDSLFDPPGGSIWQIVADQDTTTVTFLAKPEVTGLPLRPVLLNHGEVFRFFASDSFVVKSSHPITVAQGMDCEPTLSSAVATDPWLQELWFAVLPKFDHQIAIARDAKTPVYLDEARVDEAAFKDVGGGYDVARLTLPVCPPSAGVCTHHLVGKFGLTLRGMDVVCSYAWTAPTWFPCVDHESPGCVN